MPNFCIGSRCDGVLGGWENSFWVVVLCLPSPSEECGFSLVSPIPSKKIYSTKTTDIIQAVTAPTISWVNLPSLKLSARPWQNHGWKMKFPFGKVTFQGWTVGFREGILKRRFCGFPGKVCSRRLGGTGSWSWSTGGRWSDGDDGLLGGSSQWLINGRLLTTY